MTCARFHARCTPQPEFARTGRCVSTQLYPTTNTMVTLGKWNKLFSLRSMRRVFISRDHDERR